MIDATDGNGQGGAAGVAELLNQARTALAAQDLSGAEAAILRVFDLVPYHPQAVGLYGTLAAMRGDMGAAHERLSFAAARLPDDAQVQFNHANVLAMRGELAAAEQAWRRAIAADPKHFEAMGNLADMLLGQGRAGDAAAVLEQAVAANPYAAPLHSALAFARFRLGDLEGSYAALEEAYHLAPEDLSILLGLGDLAVQRGRDDTARGWYEAAQAIAPDNEKAAAALARLAG